MAGWVEYRANLGHPGWNGAAWPADRWRVNADGEWESNYGRGYKRSWCDWAPEVQSGAIVPVIAADDPPSDLALAMALQLARLMTRRSSTAWDDTTSTDTIYADLEAADWLRQQVTQILLERSAASSGEN